MANSLRTFVPLDDETLPTDPALAAAALTAQFVAIYQEHDLLLQNQMRLAEPAHEGLKQLRKTLQKSRAVTDMVQQVPRPVECTPDELVQWQLLETTTKRVQLCTDHLLSRLPKGLE